VKYSDNVWNLPFNGALSLSFGEYSGDGQASSLFPLSLFHLLMGAPLSRVTDSECEPLFPSRQSKTLRKLNLNHPFLSVLEGNR
jgi:hypothetical protein